MRRLDGNALTLLLTGMSMTGLVALCARIRHLRTPRADVYEVPVLLGYVTVLAAMLLAGVAWLPGATGELGKATFLLYLTPGFALAAGLTVYLLRYKVTLTTDTMEIRAFRTHSVPLSQVADSDVRVGRSRELVVYLMNGRRLRFSGMLAGFDDLVEQLCARRLGAETVNTGSALKLSDHAREEQAIRRSLMLIVGGACLLAALLVSERLLGR